MTSGSDKSAISELFRELFEGMMPGGTGTWFVQGTEGIFDAIDTCSAAKASSKVPGQSATIGAHLFHLNYYLSLFNSSIRGESPNADWSGTWTHQQFSEQSWAELGAEVRTEYQFALDWYRSDAPPASGEQAIYAVANLAHAAYHLGAIRALIPLVAS